MIQKLYHILWQSQVSQISWREFRPLLQIGHRLLPPQRMVRALLASRLTQAKRTWDHPAGSYIRRHSSSANVAPMKEVRVRFAPSPTGTQRQFSRILGVFLESQQNVNVSYCYCCRTSSFGWLSYCANQLLVCAKT